MELSFSPMSKLKIFLEMIKFSHTVFALPFALTSAFIASNGMPSWYQLFWIVMAMIGARTGAMSFNRLVDLEIDAKNPRTKDRPLPKGLISKEAVIFYTVVSFLLLVYAAYKLNELCFYLSPIAIIILCGYSLTKRFTHLSHIVLGLALSGAPLGAWIAIKGNIETIPLILSFAVLFWVAGFDILYALQDYDFDRKEGLYSIPVKFGVKKSIMISRVFHSIMVLFLTLLYFLRGFGFFYLLGLVIIAILLLYEHSLVKENDLSKLDVAFFNMNGYISLIYFIFTLVDIYWKG
jgi:4-hydroxybenzoate polyprenyltransferase